MGRVVKQSIEIARRTGGIKKMYKGGVPKGYVINQYQFARLYKYKKRSKMANINLQLDISVSVNMIYLK